MPPVIILSPFFNEPSHFPVLVNRFFFYLHPPINNLNPFSHSDPKFKYTSDIFKGSFFSRANLRGLAAAGVATEYHDRVWLHTADDLLPPFVHRQGVPVSFAEVVLLLQKDLKLKNC